MKLRLGKTAAHPAHSQAKNGVCKRRKVEKPNIYLPREVLFSILLLLPAKLLLEVVRHVCKQWYDIVSDPCFIRAHSQMPHITSASFIIQNVSELHELYWSDSFKVTTIQLPFRAMIVGSYNGLILLCNSQHLLQLHLINPLIKLMLSLPPIVSANLRDSPSTSYSFAATSSGHYKVVHFSLNRNIDGCEMNVFTIGVDKAWRPIDLQHSPGIPMNFFTTFIPFRTSGMIIAGFIYWCTNVSFSVAMDVDTETFYRFYWPAGVHGLSCHSYFINLGTALGLMTVDDINKHGIWTIRKLTDIKSSVWTTITRIDIEAIASKVSNGKWTYDTRIIKPFRMIDGELWFNDRVGSKYFLIIRYNLANESFVSFRVDVPPNSVSLFPYVPTLISPKTLST